MLQHQLTVSFSISEVESGAWQARGKNFTLFLEANNRSELVGYIVGAVQALGQWIVDTKPADESLEDYCLAIGVECEAVELEEGLELALRDLHEAMDHASKVLSVTQRIPV